MLLLQRGTEPPAPGGPHGKGHSHSTQLHRASPNCEAWGSHHTLGMALPAPNLSLQRDKKPNPANYLGYTINVINYTVSEDLSRFSFSR